MKGGRLEAEVDRCRVEANWRRLAEILPWIQASNSGMTELAGMIEGEVALETFVEQHSELLVPQKEFEVNLKQAEAALENTLRSPIAAMKAHVHLEASLLLAKLHYFTGHYEEALKDIARSRLDADNVQFVTLRTLRLAAEGYAVQGLALEQNLNGKPEKTRQGLQTRIVNCFEKAAELAISYVQELDKSLRLPVNGTSSTNTGRCDRIGELLESTLERVPTLRTNPSSSSTSSSWVELNTGTEQNLEWYRRIMTALGDKTIGDRLQQRLSRQLAEYLLRSSRPNSSSSSASSYHPEMVDSQSIQQKNQMLGFYAGSNRNYFSPRSRMEEILLLLLISEILASKDVVLTRSEEATTNRIQTVRNAKKVHNLLAMVLSTLRQYHLLASIYERAMKFAYQDGSIWFQFALSLMCCGRWYRSVRVLDQCLSVDDPSTTRTIEDGDHIAKLMLAAKMCIEEIGLHEAGYDYANRAVQLCKDNWLTGRCMLLRAMAFSMRVPLASAHQERKVILQQTIAMFEQVIIVDPMDSSAHFLAAIHCAMARDVTTARKHCENSLSLRPEQPNAMMLMALLLTSTGRMKDAFEMVNASLQQFPNHYGLLVLRSKLDIRFGRVEEALKTSRHLLSFWRSVDAETAPFGYVGDQAMMGMAEANQLTVTGTRSLAGKDSSITLPGNFDMTDGVSVIATGTGTNLSEYGGVANSTIAESIGLLSTQDGRNAVHSVFRLQAAIWQELAELYLSLDRLSEVQSCVEEACANFASCHQTLYLKGRLLSARSQRPDLLDPGLRERLRAEAKASFLGALAIYPSHLPSLRHLAAVYRAEGNSRMAEKMLRDLVRVEPLDEQSWQQLGVLLADQGQHERAVECFNAAAAISPSSPVLPFSIVPLQL